MIEVNLVNLGDLQGQNLVTDKENKNEVKQIE